MEDKSVTGWAARKTGPEDVLFRVLYCGMDHTDLHQIRNEIHLTNYPLVPGHEVVGEVLDLGTEVKKFGVGDVVGVGCIVGACGECLSCKSNLEQYCNKRILTYNGINIDGRPTQGGFSSAIVVHQRFVVKIPEKLAPEQAAPLLCAGVTAYSPLKQFIGSGKALKAGILGLGGVGHLGVVIAKAMGHHVTVISSSDRKREEALDVLGADAFLVSSNVAEMEAAADSLDYILDTVPVVHPLQSYLSLLRVGGKKKIVGSFLGSMEETQEILEFWTEKGLTSMVEVVKMDYVNEAFERTERNDARYRFVLDVAGSNLDGQSP